MSIDVVNCKSNSSNEKKNSKNIDNKFVILKKRNDSFQKSFELFTNNSPTNNLQNSEDQKYNSLLIDNIIGSVNSENDKMKLNSDFKITLNISNYKKSKFFKFIKLLRKIKKINKNNNDF